MVAARALPRVGAARQQTHPPEDAEANVRELLARNYSIHFHVWDQPAFTDFLGGVLLNSAILLLGILGIIASSSHRRQFSLLLFAWTSVVMLGVLTLNESFATLLPRLLYTLPLPVLSAMGFLSLTRYTAGFVAGPTGEQRRLGRSLMVFVFAFIYALLLAYSLRIVDIVPNA